MPVNRPGEMSATLRGARSSEMIKSTSDAPIPAKTTDLLNFMVNSNVKRKQTLGSSNEKIRTEKKSLREHTFAKITVHDSVREQKI